jgi:hypothetical protein
MSASGGRPCPTLRTIVITLAKEIASPSAIRVSQNLICGTLTLTTAPRNKPPLRASISSLLTEQLLELGLRHIPQTPPKVICNQSPLQHPKTSPHQGTPFSPHLPPSMDSPATMTCRTLCSLTQVSCGESLCRRPVAMRPTRHARTPPATMDTRWRLY